MAQKGKASKTTVENLILNLNQFSEAVKNELSNMMSKANELADTWKDSQYKQFITFVSELNNSIRNDLNSLDNAKDNLQSIINKY